MEIVLVDCFDPNRIKPSGMNSYLQDLSSFLIKNGVKTTIIGYSHEEEGKIPENKKLNFIPVSEGKDISGYGFLLKLLRKAPSIKLPEDAIIFGQRPDQMIPFIFSRTRNPKVCMLHGPACDGFCFKKGRIVGFLYNCVEGFILKNIDHVVMVSDRVRKRYIERYPWIEAKSSVVSDGVDLSRFKPMDKQDARKRQGLADEGENQKIIMFAGRFEKEKNPDLLLKTFKLIEEDCAKNKLGYNVRLIMVGNGKLKEKIMEKAAELKIKNILFTGSVRRDLMPEMLNCADVFVLTSFYEGGPTVVLEALACGVPVVSTDVGYVSDVVSDGLTGYVLPTPGNASEMKEHILEVLGGEYDREACVKSVERRSWDSIVRDLLEIFNNRVRKA